MKKLLSLLLAMLMLLSLTACGEKEKDEEVFYTFYDYNSSMPSKMSPHTWDTNLESEFLQYMRTPLVRAQISNTENGDFTWALQGATSITDITADNLDLLEKYGCAKPAGQDDYTGAEGYVWQIKLNPNVKWQDGTPVTADTYVNSMELMLRPSMKNYRASTYINGVSELPGAKNYYYGEGTFEDVGFYKVDDLTFNVCLLAAQDWDTFNSTASGFYCVYEPLYLGGMQETSGVESTDYMTSDTTSFSYGPYIMTSWQTEKQCTFEKNPYYFAYTKDEKTGRLVGTSSWEIDGGHKEVYMADKIVFNVFTNDAAKQSFLKGELSTWVPGAEDLPSYLFSDKLYKEKETFTQSFFCNTDVEALKNMDATTDNKNSVVWSNTNFRKAFSLAIDRDEWVGATAGYIPNFGLWNDTYYVNVYEAPLRYRDGEYAMQGICDLYNVTWGEGTNFATLRDAYKSINGYDLAQAKELMKKACEELVAAGLYTEGEEIVIRIAYKKGSLDSTDNAQLSLFNKYINAAAEGSGFGHITLDGIGNVTDRYGDVGKGLFAMGYGAWGGGNAKMTTNLRVYMDNTASSGGIDERACWTPEEEFFTMNVNGEDVTMTYTQWANSTAGVGRFANADVDTRLKIFATLETNYLSKVYRIPLATSAKYKLLSYQVDYITDQQNPLYTFGGVELMHFNMTDAQWAKKVEAGLSYE